MRLIASDLDGTLLAPDGTLPPATADAVRAAHARGVHFVVATGRPSRWLHCLEPLADLEPLVIASNGAVVYDLAADRVLRRHAFAPEQVRAIADAVRSAVPGVTFGLERGDLFGLEPGSPSDHAHFPGVVHRPLGELIDTVTPVVKLLIYSTEVGCDELAERVAPAVLGLATATTSVIHDRFGMVELSVPGVTKAVALAEICADLGVASADVVAFGDMPNDLDMLDWAGRGFVMADGHPSLLGRFPLAGTCASGGVGRTIRALLGPRG